MFAFSSIFIIEFLSFADCIAVTPRVESVTTSAQAAPIAR